MIIQCPECQSRYDSSNRNNGEAISCRCGVEILVPDLPNLARSWNCPNCSGNVDPSKSRCEYCDAYIAFARCPACFSIAPYDEAKHCAECGELLILPVKPISKNQKKLPCPRCNGALKSKVVDSHLVDNCADCGGVWLSHHLLDTLLKKEPLNSVGALGKLPPKTEMQRLNNQIRYLQCPECDNYMNRRNFMSHSGIILDECHEHGIWFDKHELAVALQYVRSNSKRSISDFNNEPITSRDKTEVFDIKYEDLKLLLAEFPSWVSKDFQ